MSQAGTSRAPEILLTIPDVAERLALTPRSVWRMISHGHLDVVRMPGTGASRGSTRIRESVLNAYIESLSSDPFRHLADTDQHEL